MVCLLSKKNSHVGKQKYYIPTVRLDKYINGLGKRTTVFISKDTEEKFHYFCVDFPHEVWKSRLCDRADSERWRVSVLAISEHFC